MASVYEETLRRVQRNRAYEHPQPFGHHFLPDPIARDDRDSIALHLGRSNLYMT